LYIKTIEVAIATFETLPTSFTSAPRCLHSSGVVNGLRGAPYGYRGVIPDDWRHLADKTVQPEAD
jgi:hypothetical protein